VTRKESGILGFATLIIIGIGLTMIGTIVEMSSFGDKP